MCSEQPNRTRFVFYSKSADRAPGRGAHEILSSTTSQDKKQYSKLAEETHWRRVLSNFDESVEFEYAMRNAPNCVWKFKSIESAYQAEKIAIADIKKAELFQTYSAEKAKRMHKIAHLTPERLKQWGATSASIMEAIARAKYGVPPFYKDASSIKAPVVSKKLTLSSLTKCQRILVLTGDAELVHLVTRRGSPSHLVRFEHLEKIRSILLKAI